MSTWLPHFLDLLVLLMCVINARSAHKRRDWDATFGWIVAMIGWFCVMMDNLPKG